MIRQTGLVVLGPPALGSRERPPSALSFACMGVFRIVSLTSHELLPTLAPGAAIWSQTGGSQPSHCRCQDPGSRLYSALEGDSQGVSSGSLILSPGPGSWLEQPGACSKLPTWLWSIMDHTLFSRAEQGPLGQDMASAQSSGASVTVDESWDAPGRPGLGPIQPWGALSRQQV